MIYFNNLWQILNNKQKKQSLILFFLVILSVLFELIGIGAVLPTLIVILEDDLVNKFIIFKSFENIINQYNYQNIQLFSLFLLLFIFFVKNFFLSYFIWWQNKFSTDITISISRKLFSAYLLFPYIFHLKNNSAKLIRNIGSEVFSFQQFLIRSIILFSEIIILISIIIFLLFLEFQSTIFVLIFFGIFFIIFTTFYNKKTKKWKIERLHYGEQSTKHLLQGLHSIKEVKIFSRENFFLNNFFINNYHQLRIYQKHNTFTGLPRLFIEFIGVSILVLLIFFQILSNNNVNDIILLIGLFSVAAFRLLPSVNRIINALQDLMLFVPSLTIVHDEITNLKKVNLDKSNQKNDMPSNTFEDDFILKFKNINFKYNKDVSVINNLNLSVKKGECIGIIGKTGCGKTTLVDIMLGLLNPSSGQMNINKFDITQNMDLWRSNISYVPQTIYLVDDSIKKNIAFGIDDNQIDNTKLQTALELSQLKEFIGTLKDGVNTNVGERGVKLSGGQRQRIGIARALYNNPKILFLDESTSSLDNDTEERVMKSIFNLKFKKTIFIVAHRHSTIINCDRIIEIENGSIIREGKPEVMI